MHRILIDPGTRVLLSTRIVATDSPWQAPRVCLQIRTDHDSGVLLEFGDPNSLRLLASAARTLHADCRAAFRRRTPRPVARSLAL